MPRSRCLSNLMLNIVCDPSKQFWRLLKVVDVNVWPLIPLIQDKIPLIQDKLKQLHKTDCTIYKTVRVWRYKIDREIMFWTWIGCWVATFFYLNWELNCDFFFFFTWIESWIVAVWDLNWELNCDFLLPSSLPFLWLLINSKLIFLFYCN